MKIHRFIGQFQLKEGEVLLHDPEIIHQIWDVLKLRAGERIILCNGRGQEAEGTLGERTNQGISVMLGPVFDNKNEPAREVVLYCAILKKENFEMVCQKVTEAGATRIVPVVSERTVKLGLRQDRLGVIIREAAEQSGRGVVPELMEPMDFAKALTDSRSCSKRVLFDPSGVATPLGSDSIALFVGPEGGWSERELEEAREAGLECARLGSRILRAETAAIIATYLAAKA